MIGFDPIFPPALILPGSALAAVLILWSHLRLAKILRRAHVAGLTSLRAAAALMIILLLLNPHSTRQIPDPDGFRVVILADASGSMETRDLEGGTRTRADWVDHWLRDLRPGEDRAFGGTSRLDVRLFAEQTQPWKGEYHLLPGRTALGDALEEQLRASGDSPPGAVLVVSDGNSNHGKPLMEAARALRDSGIPVSAIGVGSLTAAGEVSGGFASSRLRGRQNEEMEVPVILRNTRDRDASLTLELREGDHSLARRQIILPAQTESHREIFTLTPSRSGGFTHRLSIRPEEGPELTDLATVQIEEPDVFNILYLAGRPSPELRFLQQALEGSDQLRLQAIVRTGPESFWHLLTKEKERLVPRGRFPGDPSFYGEFHAILADESSLAELEENGRVLRDFVASRGGGLLLRGEINGLPEDLAALSPVVEASTVIPSRRQALSISPAPLFSQVAGGTLFQQPGLFWDEGVPVARAAEWKRGARPVLQTEGGGAALMTVQAYGAGRVGHLGLTETWRWRLDSAAGVEQHRVFWNNALAWLASNRKPRLTVSHDGGRFPVAEEIELKLSATGADFRPAREAVVTARLTMPSGEEEELKLNPSFRAPGEFSRSFLPRETGEHRVTYEIVFPEGEILQENQFFLVAPGAEELEDRAFREDGLRDLARVTGGAYFHYREWGKNTELPLAKSVPLLEERRFFTGNGLFLFLLALPLFLEWYFRRNLGLK